MDAAHFERMLKARKAEIENRLTKIDTDLSQLKSADSAERAVESENDEVLEEFGQVGEGELRGIDAALDRLHAGTFGTCVSCGEPISVERLQAVPHTPFCKDCAAAR
ncbi:TraR/DksA family transcriptional regulator [Rhizobium glycinendophyticum]|uniref:TraR/DksA family transcriptional regulator n=2 Tax=Rhizobium glycinendophyticum TaxID=2589807 RepID=A0A504UG23_9HYPH|nr:TraR/DksA family transcriptional regulator [Rhizobium glycinendophyticum]TPP12030.1 TraR/DksA family transcriptional regulator [Rhizobium glycinendophyticum]